MAEDLKTIKDYFESLPREKRDALENLRDQIKSIVPEAVEAVTYGVPGLKFKDKNLAGYAATNDGLSYYPMIPKAIEDYKDELKDFELSKGAIKFTLENPLPKKLIEKIVRARVEQILKK